jgi:hypothetical protein
VGAGGRNDPNNVCTCEEMNQKNKNRNKSTGKRKKMYQ